jgi:DNA sulfur modification protein DndD
MREGKGFSPHEIGVLREERARVYEENKRLLTEFRQLFEYAPFAIAGRILGNLERQVRSEALRKKSYSDYEVLRDKVKSIVQALENDRGEPLNKIDRATRTYYLARVRELLQQHFLQAEQGKQPEEFRPLHDFTEGETNRLNVMLSSIRTTYRSRLQTLSSSLKMNRVANSDLSRKLNMAESVESDELLRTYRLEKDKVDKEIASTDEAMLVISEHIGALENALIAKRALFEELAQKIKVDEKYRDMDKLVNRLLYEIDTFVMRMKCEKRESLESRILSNLSILMHKKDFVHKVSIDIGGETLDIHLVDRSNKEIRKDDLSRGEQQLYATAILKALVEESGVDFPVFIDSPLQKFDDRHSRNIITDFYPCISRQVVIFPLLNKELREEEYKLLIDRVCKTFVIENSDKDASCFKEVVPVNLFGRDS